MPEDLASERAAGLPQLTRFKVLRRIGEGGSGLVYEAIDRDRQASVALKMLRVLDGEMLLRLKEEFRALQDIEHPNLIRLFELSCDEGTWFYTMELVNGQSFSAYVAGDAEPASRVHVRELAELATGKHERTGSRTVNPLRARPLVDYARLRESLAQLARGLVALHAAGKVHRDIKPSNVLVARDGRVVILDLGLVSDSTDAHEVEDGVVVGTISHMAPEQAAGGDVGAAADWYSVGVGPLPVPHRAASVRGGPSRGAQPQASRGPPEAARRRARRAGRSRRARAWTSWRATRPNVPRG